MELRGFFMRSYMLFFMFYIKNCTEKTSMLFLMQFFMLCIKNCIENRKNTPLKMEKLNSIVNGVLNGE